MLSESIPQNSPSHKQTTLMSSLTSNFYVLLLTHCLAFLIFCWSLHRRHHQEPSLLCFTSLLALPHPALFLFSLILPPWLTSSSLSPSKFRSAADCGCFPAPWGKKGKALFSPYKLSVLFFYSCLWNSHFLTQVFCLLFQNYLHYLSPPYSLNWR